ncbi:MAG: acyltransferase [Bacteroidetes bacterium]|nr:MAG: acyltransferase [Bacteroidota bacterium]
MRFIFKTVFKILGWKISGDVPRNINKYIIIVAPHTSNWDFPIGVAVRSIMRFKSNFLGKKELFESPLGWLFKKLGGFPVDRSKSSNMVDEVVEIIKREQNFVVAITPEGTRKNVKRWKTGFYFIASKAGIPIVMAGIDYKRKTVFFEKPFYPSGDLEKDAGIMQEFFKDKVGKNGMAAPVL